MSIVSFAQKSTRQRRSKARVKNFDVVQSIFTGQFGVAQIGYGPTEEDRVLTITPFDSKAEAEAFAAELRAEN